MLTRYRRLPIQDIIGYACKGVVKLLLNQFINFIVMFLLLKF